MFVNEELDNSKSNLAKMNFPVYFSPYIHKKKSIGNLYTEPRKIPIEKESNSRNKKQKVNYSIKISTSNNKSNQESLTKRLKLASDKNKKGRNMHQSYIKLNTKLYLKKNAIPNLASFHNLNSEYPPTPLVKNSTTNIIISNSNSNSIKSTDKKNNKTQNKNIKLIFGKNSNNNLNTKNYNTNSNNNLLKKTAGSANELFRSNFIKKSKTKNVSELNNLNNINNQIGYILTTTGNNNVKNKAFLSPQNISGQKIIFLKNDKSKIKEGKERSRKSSTSSSNKDQKRNVQSKKSEKNVNVEDLNLLDERNKSVQYLLRNTYNNVKIYPTTVLNNKIIYQENKKNEKISHSVNTSENSSIHHSSNKKRIDANKNKISIHINNKNNENIDMIKKSDECQSVEEVHFLFVKTIHKGQNMIINMDKKNN